MLQLQEQRPVFGHATATNRSTLVVMWDTSHDDAQLVSRARTNITLAPLVHLNGPEISREANASVVRPLDESSPSLARMIGRPLHPIARVCFPGDNRGAERGSPDASPQELGGFRSGYARGQRRFSAGPRGKRGKQEPPLP